MNLKNFQRRLYVAVHSTVVAMTTANGPIHALDFSETQDPCAGSLPTEPISMKAVLNKPPQIPQFSPIPSEPVALPNTAASPAEKLAALIGLQIDLRPQNTLAQIWNDKSSPSFHNKNAVAKAAIEMKNPDGSPQFHFIIVSPGSRAPRDSQGRPLARESWKASNSLTQPNIAPPAAVMGYSVYGSDRDGSSSQFDASYLNGLSKKAWGARDPGFDQTLATFEDKFKNTDTYSNFRGGFFKITPDNIPTIALKQDWSSNMTIMHEMMHAEFHSQRQAGPLSPEMQKLKDAVPAESFAKIQEAAEELVVHSTMAANGQKWGYSSAETAENQSDIAAHKQELSELIHEAHLENNPEVRKIQALADQIN